MKMISTSPQYTNLVSRLLIVLACLSLAACSKHVVIWKPIDASRKDQIAGAQFSVKHTGDYRFAFMFLKAETLDDIRLQRKIWGDVDNEGVPIHVNIRIHRNKILVHNQNIRSVATAWGMTYLHEERMLNTAVRLIRIIELVPGDYTVEIRTLDDAEQFKDIETYISFMRYNPKH